MVALPEVQKSQRKYRGQPGYCVGCYAEERGRHGTFLEQFGYPETDEHVGIDFNQESDERE